MPCYVDSLQSHGWVLRGHVVKSCHLVADTDGELHAMAEQIGMKRRWHQPPPHHMSHYDLTAFRRELAVALGAVELTRVQFVARMPCLRCRTARRAEGNRLCSECTKLADLEKRTR